MAILERTIRNQNFDALLHRLEQEIVSGSWSANLEASSDFREGSARCSVRVFERYSMMGGSQAVFFMVNTLGEEAFLEEVKQVLDDIASE